MFTKKMKLSLYGIAVPCLVLAGTNHLLPADVRIDSIVHKPNGVTLNWTNSEPGDAYTLQYRASPSTGPWSPVWSRYRWPGVMTNWTEPTRVLSNAGFYRVLAEPIRLPERGKVLSTQLLRQFSLSQIASYLNADGVPTTNAVWTVQYYKIVYETVDPFGLPIIASGGLFVPQGVVGAMPLLSDQHGTEIYKAWVPSQNDYYWFSEALFFASSGYLTLMPDYLGLGESPGLHPWLHSKTEASAVVDMLRAVKTFCTESNIAFNSQLFLTGYSQGGHATAAVQREIETHHTNEFTVTASAPMAGLYDVSGILHFVAASNDFRKPFGIVYPLAAWLPIYDFAETMEELLASPYDQTLPPLFDGSHILGDDILPAMAIGVESTLDANFLSDLRSDTNHPFWQATADNDLLDWAPRAPMHLYHCSGDDRAPYWNAVSALHAYTNNGACCVELTNPETGGPLNHDQCWAPSMVATKAWFDSMKK